MLNLEHLKVLYKETKTFIIIILLIFISFTANIQISDLQKIFDKNLIIDISLTNDIKGNISGVKKGTFFI